MIGCCGFECCGFDGNNVEEEEENDQHGVIRRLFKLISRKEYIGNSLLVCCVRFLHVSYNSTSNSNSLYSSQNKRTLKKKDKKKRINPIRMVSCLFSI